MIALAIAAASLAGLFLLPSLLAYWLAVKAYDAFCRWRE